MKIDAIVLAGGIIDSKLGEHTGASSEAFIRIGEQPMVDYVVRALENSEQVGRTVLVGPVQELEGAYKGRTTVVAPGDSVVGSVQSGLAAVEKADFVLILTCDIPLISAEAVDNFISSCMDLGEADLYYPIVEKSVSEEKYPGAKRTYVALVDGTFTGGNMFLIRPEIVAARVDLANQLIALRKSPLALCRVIGFGFVLKYVLHRLTVRDAEVTFSKLLDLRGLTVKCSYPEVGMDVDKPSDLELVEQVLLGAP